MDQELKLKADVVQEADFSLILDAFRVASENFIISVGILEGNYGDEGN